jgi:hypothetical protein
LFLYMGSARVAVGEIVVFNIRGRCALALCFVSLACRVRPAAFAERPRLRLQGDTHRAPRHSGARPGGERAAGRADEGRQQLWGRQGARAHDDPPPPHARAPGASPPPVPPRLPGAPVPAARRHTHARTLTRRCPC